MASCLDAQECHNEEVIDPNLMCELMLLAGRESKAFSYDGINDNLRFTAVKSLYYSKHVRSVNERFTFQVAALDMVAARMPFMNKSGRIIPAADDAGRDGAGALTNAFYVWRLKCSFRKEVRPVL